MQVVEVGAEFKSFQELDGAIKAYEAENFVNLIIRDTRKVEAAAKRNHKKTYNPAIKYSDIAFCCTYGGKKYVSHSTGKRSHNTTKQACPFSLKVRATVDGQRLLVREMCTTHNHEISEEDFRFHPKQRKLQQDSQEEIANLLSFQPDKKLLREKLMEVTGKVILMKDIHNIKTRIAKKDKGGKSEAQAQNESEVGKKPVEKEELLSQPTLTSSGANTPAMVSAPVSVSIPISQDATSPQQPANSQPPVIQCQLTTSHSVIQQQMQHPSQIPPCPGMNSTAFNAHHQEYPHLLQPQSEFHSYLNLQPCYSLSQQPSNLYQPVNPQPFIQPPTLINPMGFQPRYESGLSTIQAPVPAITIPGPSTSPGTLEQSTQFRQWTANIDQGILTASSFQNQQGLTTNTTIQSQPSYHHVPITHLVSKSGTLSVSNSVQPGIINDLTPFTSTAMQQQPSQILQPQQQQVSEPPQGLRGRKRKTGGNRISVRPKKTALQADKETILRKYFQKATVKLYFNERLKSPGNRLLSPLKADNISGCAMSSDPAKEKFHEMLTPLSWLFGIWKSDGGRGIYPTLADFSYIEEAKFRPIPSKPIIEYKFYSAKPDNSMPMHRETGFIRIKPQTNNIAFVAAHNLGVVEIQEGQVNGQEITVESTNIGRTSFNKPPEVKKVKRTLKRSGDELEHVMYMETDKTEMSEHLRITFKKV